MGAPRSSGEDEEAVTVTSPYDAVTVNLVGSDLYAEYHDCGSHKIALNVKMDAEYALALRDRLNKINFVFQKGKS